MEFDTFTVALLETGSDTPSKNATETHALQDAHMDYLARLHEAGDLQAAGPLVIPPGSSIRGLCLCRLPTEAVRALLERDPLVRAGRLTVRIFSWMVPKGAISFSRTTFPHSEAEL